MKVIHSLPKIPIEYPTFVALGSFDGVHLGHQALISYTVNEANKANGKSIVLTFDPHPLKVLNPKQPLSLILSNKQKASKIAALGPEQLIFLPFTKELAAKTPEEFAVMLKKNLNPFALVVGFDYSFGRGGSGNPEILKSLGKNLGFEVHILSAQNLEGIPVSSTRIRQALAMGDIKLAKRLLGYWPVIEGRVIEGEKRGRKLGFPTANIKLEDLILSEGVYVATVELDSIKYLGVVNIGKKPTFREDRKIEVEVHIVDFQGDLYGTSLEMHILGRIRSELKFDNSSQLIQQIKKDINFAKQLFKKL